MKILIQRIGIWLKQKDISLESVSSMSCFILGVYGERVFIYLHTLFKSLSPEIFSFFCILCTYLGIRKISNTIAISKHQHDKESKSQLKLEEKNETEKGSPKDI